MANVSNKYYQTYDANGQKGDFDDHDRYLQQTTTGNSILNELTKGDPFKGIVKLVNTAKQFNVKTELTNILVGSTNQPLESMIGRIANMDNYKFQYGINDLLIDPNKSIYRNYVDKIEDPTILTFTLEIDEVNSPMFQETGGVNDFLQIRRSEFPSEGIISLENQNPAATLSSVAGLYDQIDEILDEFRRKIREFFTPYQSRSQSNAFYSKSYYITSVSGVSELDKVWTGTDEGGKYEFSKLKLSMREDVKLSARNLYFLYNSLRMHRRSGKVLIPENLLRFNMWVKISEIRNFTSLRFAVETGANQDIIDAIKRDVTAIYYYVQDCSFDFSKLHRDTYSVEDDKNYENLEFEILFRRAFRVFKPTLLKAEETAVDAIYGIDERTAEAAIITKNYPLQNFLGRNIGDAVRPSLMPELTQFVRQSDPINSRTKETKSSKNYSDSQSVTGNNSTQKLFQSLGKFLSTGQVNLNPNNLGGIVGKGLNLASQAVTRLAQSAKNTVIQKRNQLVRDLENKVKNKVGFGVPRPKNIYKPGDGSGVIGNTLESLSKATGIDFLAIREGRNIQSFKNTDVNALNPALGGRDILSGPGGDYSNLNPNKATGQSIDDVQPDVNFTIVPPNEDLGKTTNYDRGKIVAQNKHNLYQEITGLVGFGSTDALKDRLRPDQYPNSDLHPDANFQPDLTLLNTDLQPDGNRINDISLLQNIEGESNFQPDLSLLNNDLHPDNNRVNDTNVLKVDLQPDDNHINDTNVLRVDLQPDDNRTADLSLLKDNLQSGAASNNDINVLNVDLHPNDTRLNDTSVLKDLTEDNVENPNDVKILNSNLQQSNITNTNITEFENINVTEQNTFDKPSLENDLHPESNLKLDTSILKNIQIETTEPLKEELSKINTDTAKTDGIVLDKINTDTAKTDDIVLDKINIDKSEKKSDDLGNVGK